MLIKSFRFRYFLGHLLISACIAMMSLFLIFAIWYPKPLDIALGVGHIIWIMLGIDVVLGPLLTLIIAKEGKKTLKFDLAVIAIVQLLALAYGLHSIEKGRPMAIAFDVNRFELVQKYALQNKDYAPILNQFKAQQDKSIPAVAVRPAKDDEELTQRMNDELLNGISSAANPDLYETLEQNAAIIHKEMKPIAQLTKFNDEASVKPILAKYPNADYFLPIVASEVNMTVLLDSKDANFAQVVNLRPW